MTKKPIVIIGISLLLIGILVLSYWLKETPARRTLLEIKDFCDVLEKEEKTACEKIKAIHRNKVGQELIMTVARKLVENYGYINASRKICQQLESRPTQQVCSGFAIVGINSTAALEECNLIEEEDKRTECITILSKHIEELEVPK